ERMAELFQPKVVRRKELLPAPGTVVPGGSVAGHPPLDAAAGDAEVECQPGEAPVLPPCRFYPSAEGAGRAADLDLPGDPAVLLRAVGTFPILAPLKDLASADEHFVPLVVEIGSLIDEGEVGECKHHISPVWTRTLGADLLNSGNLKLLFAHLLRLEL